MAQLAVQGNPKPIMPFLWGDNGQALTPAQAAAQQQIAQALIVNAGTPQNVGEGLGAIGKALVARNALSRSNEAIATGTEQATRDLQGVLTDPSKAADFLASDQYATESQKAVAQAILSQQMMLTNPDMIAQRANLAAETQKNLAEAGMMQNGGAAVGSPIQAADGSYYIPTQYGGNMRPLTAGGGGGVPSAAPVAIPTDVQGSNIPLAAPAPLTPAGAGGVAAPVGNTTITPAAPAAAAQGAPKFLTAAEQAAAKAKGEDTGKIAAAQPEKMVAAHTAIQQLDDSDRLVSGFIDQAIQQANGLSTGWVGKLSEQLPSSPAYKLARTLDTVKSNVGFDKLQAMRAASPTGGALGSVSNMEEQMLQSVLGSLDQGQDPQVIIANLQQMKGFIRSNNLQRKQAYNADFGGVTPLNGDTSFNHVNVPGSPYYGGWGKEGAIPASSAGVTPEGTIITDGKTTKIKRNGKWEPYA